MKRIFGTLLLLLITATSYGKGPKYIFYFIGDGMGPSHVLGTELYLGELQGVIGRPQKLCFTQFPESAFVTTYSATNGVTDSAASGTALSTGSKTYNSAIGVDCDTLPVYSVAAHLAAKGMAIGVATTVPINHATPSAFYAHNMSRHNYDSIAPWMLKAGYDFYAGGDVKGSSETRDIVYGKAQEQGYAIARGYSDYKKKAGTAEKMMLYQEKVSTELPYAINRNSNDLTLAQITAAGIDFLDGKSKKGFFMMIEGGKIDWGCHANDPVFITELIDMDNAVKVAYEFYQQHPDETLIVITADHETGGLALGRGPYELNLKAVASQRMSMVKLERELKAKKAKLGDKFTWEEGKKFLTDNFGFWGDVKVSDDQASRLERSFKEFMEKNDPGRLSGTVKRVISECALIGWQSGGHSNGYVPAFAIGVGAEQFHGRFDNTEICKKMAKAAGWEIK